MANMVARNVFVYGTLLAPEVVSALIHRAPTSSPALVHDYHRHGVKDRIYPAVSPAKGDKVYGKVLFDLTEWELEVFDMFEDIEYTRMVTTPILLGKTTMETTLEDQVPIGMNGEDAVVDAGIENVAKVGTATSHDSLQAYIYVWTSDVELIGDWDYEAWRRIHLEEYVKMCEEFASQLPQLPKD
ncbi:hypothetical protein CY35_07G020500 [Sphagnum magellanicum]|uniref:Uncharacterized protein n=3 Tax=Sphagnum magellanicum TaxID=128215 RepID=A0ACB8HJF3_9BRYO|nr:hypothetical protein CY35_07G020500 [Sphagnum magellanicum]KAH9556327.1 hypothetical protein CY35_07G020500 [Sphagnum magellanicum]KAH9556328.1 hypothetical protein CY35_07G020500 [Sphagnum magellanicum]